MSENGKKKEDTIQMEGIIKEPLPNRMFYVKLENGSEILAHLCGKMSQKNIRVLVGDTVVVEISPYDLGRGRIIYRQR